MLQQQIQFNYAIKPDDPKWLRVLKFFRSLGAPEPRIFMAFGVRVAQFGQENEDHCDISMGIAAECPGVAATDLFTHGVIKLFGVPNLPIDELEKMLPTLKRNSLVPEPK